MIIVRLQKNGRRHESIDLEALRQTRKHLENGVKALIVDLDKCLLRSYAGIPAFRELLRSGDAKWSDALSYLLLVVRFCLSCSRLIKFLPIP